MMTCLCALLLAMSLPVQKAPDSPGTSSQDVIVIDGHKDPSKIPEWAAWEDGFTTIDAWIGRDSGFNHDLREALTPDEFSRSSAKPSPRRPDGQRRFARRSSCGRSSRRSIRRTRQQRDKLRDRIHAIDLKYRRATLAARDRVLQSLSPGSQAVLQAWIERGKATMICEVPRSELAHWRSPE